MNEAVLKMINTYQTYKEGRDVNNEENLWTQNYMSDFIHFEDTVENLPIPVMPNTRPNNAHQFITHIVLSLGFYDTKIDALTYSTIRKSLQETKLIGTEKDTDLLK